MNKMFFVEHVGENQSLAISEIKGILEGEKQSFELSTDFPVTLASNVHNIEKRAALTRFVNELLFSCKTEDLYMNLKKIELGEGTFSVRVKQYGRKTLDTKKMEIKAGKLFKNTVNLTNPDIKLRVAITKNAYVGFNLYSEFNRDLQHRKSQFRPFHTMLSLSPVLARTLLNLARVKEGDMVLDPFCGGGSVLIETALMNMNGIGMDIDLKMVAGSKLNLDFFKLKGTLIHGDVSMLPKLFNDIDAIVTDPPYGRSAFTNKEKIESLYLRSFKEFQKILKKGGYVAIILPSKEHIKTASEYFRVMEVHTLKVHKSLTRHFTVLKNG